ncbi:MAG: ComF family protein [Lachnospiraceae bacterium]|nr:ComF family protein [Lachnospiraceae bacterium]
MLKPFFGALTRVFFPRRCPVCDGLLPLLSPGELIHPDCERKLARIRPPYCLRCGCELAADEQEYCSACARRDFHFIRNYPLWVYNDAAQHSMVCFKYHGRQEYAAYYARAFWDAYEEEIRALSPDAVIPVPIHRSRLRKRGYNQAALFAAALSRLSGIPLRSDVLARKKHTDAQKELGREARFRNMKNAFSAQKKAAAGLHRVLLADDIYTTGSTMEACAVALREAGIEAVYGATLCIAGEKN